MANRKAMLNIFNNEIDFIFNIFLADSFDVQNVGKRVK